MVLGDALLLGDAQAGQDAVGQEHQTATRAEHPGRLGNPPLGIAPDAGPVLADHQIEARAGQRHVLGVGFDQREHQTEAILAAARGGQLRRSEVEPDEAGAASGQLGGQVGGAAAQLDHVQAADVTKDAQVALGDAEQSPGELLSGPGPVGVLVGELLVHHRPQGAVAGDVGSGVRHAHLAYVVPPEPHGQADQIASPPDGAFITGTATSATMIDQLGSHHFLFCAGQCARRNSRADW